MTGKERVEKYGLKDEKLTEMLAEIIKKGLSHEDMRRLAVSSEQLPVCAKDRGDFVNDVLAEMI